MSDQDTQSTSDKGSELRLRCPQRDQLTQIPAYVEELLPAGHLARVIWEVTGQLDLSGFSEHLVVTEDGPGRAAADPRLLVALWLYATSQGVTNARELDRLCVRNLDYIWLCGGVSMNYHTLSSFRVNYGDALGQLMADILGRLLYAGLVKLEHVAQDGMRVRASAGAASFRRQATLEKHHRQAEEFLAALLEEAKDAEDDQPRGRRQAAQERAARERVARLEAALQEMPKARAAKGNKKGKGKEEEARVSRTDPEARVMKMADGGFRPAYNFQTASDTHTRVIVGVGVSSEGSDMALMPPMVEQVQKYCKKLPKYWLMDGGFASIIAIETGTALGMCVLTPVQTPRDSNRDPYAPRPGDSEAVAAWRKRMGTQEAKDIYKLRASSIELVNAQARVRHGLQQLRVRGRARALCVALWVAITHNLLIWLQHLQSVASPQLAAA
jgi:transposase